MTLRFTTVGQVAGVGSWDFSCPERADRIRIQGDSGALGLSTFGDGPLELETPAGVERFDLPNPPHIQQPLFQAVVDELLGRGRCPSTGVSAARTSDAMDRALMSYYGPRDSGFWKQPERWPGRRL